MLDDGGDVQREPLAGHLHLWPHALPIQSGGLEGPIGWKTTGQHPLGNRRLGETPNGRPNCIFFEISQPVFTSSNQQQTSTTPTKQTSVWMSLLAGVLPLIILTAPFGSSLFEACVVRAVDPVACCSFGAIQTLLNQRNRQRDLRRRGRHRRSQRRSARDRGVFEEPREVCSLGGRIPRGVLLAASGCGKTLLARPLCLTSRSSRSVA